MASSAHSIPQPVSTQAPNLSDRSARRYAVRLSDGEVFADVALEPFTRDSFRVVWYVGREGVRRGAMGNLQRARALLLRDQAREALQAGATAAGWSYRTDAGGTVVWERPQLAQEPQPAPQLAQEPQPAPQLAPDAPGASLLPWQGGGYVSLTSRRWTLELSGLAILHMYGYDDTRRYEWLITASNGFTFLAASGGPGYTSYSRAEAAMLLALSRVMHPAGHLPTSLPPRQGAISHSRREG